MAQKPHEMERWMGCVFFSSQVITVGQGYGQIQWFYYG